MWGKKRVVYASEAASVLASQPGVDGKGNKEGEEEHEYLMLSDSEQQRAYDESFRTLLLVMMEVLDVVLDLANFVTYVAGTSLLDLFGVLYSINTFMISILSLYVIKEHTSQVLLIRKELHQGIQVAKGRSRVVRNAYDLSAKEEQVEGEDLVLLEFEVVSMERQMNRARFIVVSALLEDFISLFFIGFRLGFTDLLLNTHLVTCLENPSYSGIPASCLPWSSTIGLLQAAGTITFLAHKISYVRDYYTLREIVEEKKEALNRTGLQDGSALDRFQAGAVSESEINSVVEIRKMINGEMDSVLDSSTGATDVRILGMIRKFKSDVVESAKRIQDWRAWRNKVKLNQVRRKLILNDLSVSEMPGMSQWLSAQPLVLDGSIDVEKGKVILYAYIGKRADFDTLFELLNKDQIRDCAFFILERLLYTFERLSLAHGKLFTFQILCDARNLPQSTQYPLQYVLGMFRQAFEHLSKYPFSPEVLLWKPHPDFLLALEKELPEAAGGFRQIDHFEILRTIISPEYLPSEIGGQLTFGSIKHKSDPWQLRQCQQQSLSEFVSYKACEITFFQDVTPKESDLVVDFQKYLDSLQNQGVGIAAKGKLAIKKETTVLTQELKRYERKFNVKGLKLSKSKREVIGHLQNQILILQFLESGRWIEDVPIEFRGNVNILRILRASNEDVIEAATKFLTILVHREQSGINSINQKITKGNLALDKIENLAEYFAIWPCDAVHSFDFQNRSIVALLTIDENIDHKRLRALPAKEIEKFHTYLNEYLLILADRLSRKMEKMVTVQAIHRVDRFPFTDKALSIVMSAQKTFSKEYYPGLFQRVEIVLTSSSQTLIDAIVRARHTLFSKTRDENVFFCSVHNEEALATRIDVRTLPKALGGTRDEFKTPADLANLKYKEFLPLGDLVRSIKQDGEE